MPNFSEIFNKKRVNPYLYNNKQKKQRNGYLEHINPRTRKHQIRQILK